LTDLLHYTIGVSFLLIGKSLFRTTRLASGFLNTKIKAAVSSNGFVFMTDIFCHIHQVLL